MKHWQIKIISLVFFFETLIVGFIRYADFISREPLRINLSSALDVMIWFFIIAFLLFTGAIFFDYRLRSNLIERMACLLVDQKWLMVILIGSAYIFYESFQDLLFINANIEPIHYQVYRQFLSDNIDILLLLMLGSVQALLIITISYWGSVLSWLKQVVRTRLFYLFILLGGLVLYINSLRYAEIFTKANIKIHRFHAPLVGIQVLILIIILVLLLVILTQIGKKWKWLSEEKIDLVIILLISLIAFYIWNSVPVGTQTFVDIPRPPNNEFYPTSDALYYEQGAFQFLNGGDLVDSNHIGFQIYLGILHLIMGDSYQDILPLHLVVLSAGPVLLFILGKILHSRLAGLLISGLYIVREWNALLLGEHITITNNADVMTEPLAATGVMLFLTLLVIWLQDPAKRKLMPLFVGASFGLVFLFRVEVLALFGALGFGILYYFHRNIRTGLQNLLLVVLGVLLMISPWVLYTYSSTGQTNSLFMNKWNMVRNSIRSYYEASQTDRLIDQTPIQTDIQATNLPSNQIDNQYIETQPIQNGMKLNRFEKLQYHLVNNLANQYYYLPNNYQPLLTLGSIPDILQRGGDSGDLEGDSFPERYVERYVRSLPYWLNVEWSGRLVPRSYLPIFGSILLIAVGLSQLTRDKKWFLYTALLLILGHSLILAFVTRSGGRYTIMVNWIPLVFYGIGLARLIDFGLIRLRKDLISPSWLSPTSISEITRSFSVQLDRSFFFVMAGILVFGLLYPVLDFGIPQQYTQADLKNKINEITSLIPEIDINQNLNLSSNKDYYVFYGKAIYPQYFPAGERMYDFRHGYIPDYSYERVEFFLSGTENIWVTIPGDQAEIDLPHGSEVLVVGSRIPMKFDRSGPSPVRIHTEYIKSDSIVVFKSEKQNHYPMLYPCNGPVCENTIE